MGNAGGSHPQLKQQLAVLLRQVSRHRAQRRNQFGNALQGCRRCHREAISHPATAQQNANAVYNV